MATPVVSGSIALWLQADPTLTYADVLDIIKSTAKKDEAVTGTASPVQWGAGKFDAYLGLKEVLLRQGAGVGSVAADSHKTLVSNPTGRNIELFRAGAAEIAASVFNISGICMASVRAAGENAEINVASLPAGVYILNIEGEGARRVIIR